LTTWIATAGGKDRLAAAAGSVVQTVETVLQEPPDPLAYVLLGQAHEPSDLDESEPIGDAQDRSTSPGRAQRGGWTAEPLLQADAFLGGQDYVQRRLAASHRCLLD
jgi:hypothetical protein